jgi:hypothetical protein
LGRPRAGTVRPGISSSPRKPKGIVPCDFFTVETVFLKTLYVLVFMHIQTAGSSGSG